MFLVFDEVRVLSGGFADSMLRVDILQVPGRQEAVDTTGLGDVK
jgi:hypothetical protein